MIFNNYYNIALSLNGTDMDMDPKELSFSVHDSIHTFFSTANVVLNDASGFLREYLLTLEGNVFSLTYGTEASNLVLKSNYVITHDETDEMSTAGFINGKINVFCQHEYYDKQTTICAAYKDRISAIINKLLIDYPAFSKINIQDTESNSVWYRMGVTQKDFIEKVLIPNSFQPNTNDTPYFAFIGVDGSFNYKSYHNMYSANSQITLKYNPSTVQDISITTILDIKPFRVGSIKHKHLRKRQIITRDRMTGNFITKVNTINDFPSKKSSNVFLPIVGKDIVTDYSYKSFTQKATGDRDALFARINFDEKDGLFIEKFIIKTAFNPELKSGMPIQLDLFIPSESKEPSSALYQSGKYLIEDCVHSWYGGTEKRGITELIVSRKFTTIPNNYSIKERLLK